MAVVVVVVVEVLGQVRQLIGVGLVLAVLLLLSSLLLSLSEDRLNRLA